MRSLLLILLTITTLAFANDTPEPNPVMVVQTSAGQFEVTLRPDVAPKACENFLRLSEGKYYDGVVFHRVIKGFMVQGGDPTATGMGGQSYWGAPFEDECNANIKFEKPGMVAMANKGPNTNGSQFFITTSSCPWLNQKHTIFGEVTKGYDVIQKIEASYTDKNNRPIESQKILTIYLKDLTDEEEEG